MTKYIKIHFHYRNTKSTKRRGLSCKRIKRANHNMQANFAEVKQILNQIETQEVDEYYQLGA